MKNLIPLLLMLCLTTPVNAWLLTPESHDNDDCKATGLSDADRVLLHSTHASCEAAATASALCTSTCTSGESHSGCATVSDVSALLHRLFYIKCRETRHGLVCGKPGHRVRLTPVDP